MLKKLEKGLYRYFDRQGREGKIVMQFRYGGFRIKESTNEHDIVDARKVMLKKRLEIDALQEQIVDLEMFGEDIKLSEALDTFRGNQWAGDTSHCRDSIARMEKIIAFLDDPRCVDLTHGSIRKLKQHLSSTDIGTEDSPRYRTPTTVNRFMTSLKTVLKAVMEDGLIPKLPKFVMASEKQYRRDRLIAENELRMVKVLLSRRTRTQRSTDMRHQVADVLTIAWYTGMRIGEILALRPIRHLDLDGRSIKITADIAKGKSIRTVPMHDKVWKILSMTVPNAEGILFDFDTNFVDKVWRFARKEMEVADKNFVPHAIRHTVATDLLKAGVPVTKVQALLGHEDVTTTMIYTHMVAEDVRSDLLCR